MKLQANIGGKNKNKLQLKLIIALKELTDQFIFVITVQLFFAEF